MDEYTILTTNKGGIAGAILREQHQRKEKEERSLSLLEAKIKQCIRIRNGRLATGYLIHYEHNMRAFNNNFIVSDSSVCDENCTRELCKGIRTKLLPNIQIDADGIKSLHLKKWIRFVYWAAFGIFLIIPVLAAVADFTHFFPAPIATLISTVLAFFVAQVAGQLCPYWFKNDQIVDLLKERLLFSSLGRYAKYAGYSEDEIVKLLWAKDGRRGAFIGENGYGFMQKENGKLELTNGVPIDMLRFRSWYICRSQKGNHVLVRVTHGGLIKTRGPILDDGPEVYYCTVVKQIPLILHTKWEIYRISDEEAWFEVAEGYLA